LSNKRYGLIHERKEKEHWNNIGALVLRSRGSFSDFKNKNNVGLFDMIIGWDNRWILLSVKSTRTGKISYKKHFKDVNEFRDAPVGTYKKVVVYRKGKRKEYSCGTIE